jgi:hypothetical protein
MSASIIDFVNCHIENETGDTKYINDKCLNVKEINSNNGYIQDTIKMYSLTPNSYLGLDANNNMISKETPISSSSPYAILSGVLSTQIVPAGTNQLVRFTSATIIRQNKVVIDPSFEIFTITEPGVYLVDLSISCDVINGIASLEFLLNEFSQFLLDRVDANSTSILSSKMTLKGFMNVVAGTPSFCRFRVSAQNNGMTFRNPQLSITPV